MIQNNDNVMVEKIQTTLMNTIPLWKNQMVLALGIAHSNEAAQAQRQVNDITNALLKQNAEKLHMASVETAKEAERGIVDIETLKKDQRRADSDAGRRDEDSVRGPGEAHCRRSGNGKNGERPQGQAPGNPRRRITLQKTQYRKFSVLRFWT